MSPACCCGASTQGPDPPGNVGRSIAATGAADQLAALLKGRGNRLTSTITRRELRKWLRASDEGKAVETAATRLLAGDQ